MQGWGWMALGAAAVTLWGCASSGAVTLAVPPTAALSGFKTVSVTVNSKVPETEEETKRFRELITAEFQRTGRWQVVDRDGQLALTATLTGVYRVGQAARIILGALAGQASVEADVVLRDAAGTVVSQFQAKGKSSGGTIFAGTTEQALQRAAEEIVAVFEKP